ncbi:acyl-CoA dehydrogenase/oxidase [Blakeslea trispora]|nr:acyl-CoA dehydrogenase/oxidase [Blakeslea trispora]
MPQEKLYSEEQVRKHSTLGDLWVIIDGSVYDLTRFANLHPGGQAPLVELAGKDATEAFYSLHRQEVLKRYAQYKIGVLENFEPQIEWQGDGALSNVPYAEHSAFQGFKSPYYKESHFAFRQAIRKILDPMMEEARDCDGSGDKPSDNFVRKLGSLGIFALTAGHPEYLGDSALPGGISVKDYDYFHSLLLHAEFARFCTPGFNSGLMGGLNISLPIVVNFGRPELKAKVVPEVLSGRKRIVLAVTEPYIGSDVANITTSAVKTPDGKYYIVNGVKKWVTAGQFSDYFSTAVKTDKGISMLLIERTDGVETKPIPTSYSESSGTSYVTFTDVKVPVGNLLGKENKGFHAILSNFNYERWSMIASGTMSARILVEECFKWAHQRKVFGKRLIDQPVIRFKLAKMIAAVESAHSWVESLTYQMNQMNYKEQADKLAGPIALCKFQVTRIMHEVSDDACQIFGGRAVTKTGMGKRIESFQRCYKFAAILGGSEEIVADLGVKQAMRKFPAGARL